MNQCFTIRFCCSGSNALSSFAVRSRPDSGIEIAAFVFASVAHRQAAKISSILVSCNVALLIRLVSVGFSSAKKVCFGMRSNTWSSRRQSMCPVEPKLASVMTTTLSLIRCVKFSVLPSTFQFQISSRLTRTVRQFSRKSPANRPTQSLLKRSDTVLSERRLLRTL